MSASYVLNWNSEVVCSDGPVGVLMRAIIDPKAWTVAYLAVESHHLFANGRLVPMTLVESVGESIALSSTLADVRDGLMPSENWLLSVLPGGKAWGVSNQNIPDGAVEIVRNHGIQASDGLIGRLHGLVVDQSDFHVTDLHIDIGHFPHSRQVSVPFDFLESMDGLGMHVKMTRQQIRELASI